MGRLVRILICLLLPWLMWANKASAMCEMAPEVLCSEELPSSEVDCDMEVDGAKRVSLGDEDSVSSRVHATHVLTLSLRSLMGEAGIRESRRGHNLPNASLNAPLRR